ncbi:uncharacterized protein [Rutidosis leptorrhynchoides]|uniref:uncharacterized protein n=1 Tax=Rutidosis leptorrhynchoides TaxID=125765 RepID=UPI003A9A0201
MAECTEEKNENEVPRIGAITSGELAYQHLQRLCRPYLRRNDSWFQAPGRPVAFMSLGVTEVLYHLSLITIRNSSTVSTSARGTSGMLYSLCLCRLIICCNRLIGRNQMLHGPFIVFNCMFEIPSPSFFLCIFAAIIIMYFIC